jgi:hypothetical protein
VQFTLFHGHTPISKETIMLKNLSSTPWQNMALMVAGLSLCNAALADTPWMSGPSIVTLGESVVMSGGNLPANEAAMVIVTPPNGEKYRHIIAVGSDGKLDYPLTVTSSGAYKVEVANQKDEVVGGATVLVNQ